MTQTSKPDLSGYEEEAAPFDDVLRQLLAAKPAPRHTADNQASKKEVTAEKP